MIGIVVASHGAFADGLVDAAKMLTGEQDLLVAVSLAHGVSPENFKNDVVRAINDADAGDGVLLLADLFGGTPSNSVAQVLGTCHMRAIAGANLPMLLTALLDRGDAELDELADTAMHAGQTGVVDIGEKVFGAVVQDDDQDF